MTGLSEVIGSWKTMAMRAPHTRPQRSRRGPHHLLALELHRPRLLDAVAGEQPMIDRESTVLPDPDSPTMPRVRPAPGERDAVDRPQRRPASVVKEVRQVLDLEHGDLLQRGSSGRRPLSWSCSQPVP